MRLARKWCRPSATHSDGLPDRVSKATHLRFSGFDVGRNDHAEPNAVRLAIKPEPSTGGANTGFTGRFWLSPARGGTSTYTLPVGLQRFLALSWFTHPSRKRMEGAP